MILFFFSSLAFVSFPSRSDAILSNSNVPPHIEVSGSLGVDQGNICQPTYGNETLNSDRNYDWCSNIALSNVDRPWISYSLPNTIMKLTGYSLRNGCCRYSCCCDPLTGKRIDGYCCCRLYSFSLEGSNNNIDWFTIHKIEGKKDFYYCKYETYEFPKTQSYRYVRLVLDQEWNACPRCMQINQIEFYGEAIQTSGDFVPDLNNFNENDNDESVSIIGKVKQNK